MSIHPYGHGITKTHPYRSASLLPLRAQKGPFLGPHIGGKVKALLHYAFYHSRFFSSFFPFFPVFSLDFDFFSCFHSDFGYEHVGIQNVSENTGKTGERRENNTRKLNLFTISHYSLGKKASFSRFGKFEVTNTQTQRIV